MACASIPSPTMFPARDALALTDPASAPDTLGLLDDVFTTTSFLRARSAARPPQQPLFSAGPGLCNPSPRLPSALPPSASPRLCDALPLTPDAARPVLPYYDDHDFSPLSPRAAAREAAREKERRRRTAWAHELTLRANPSANIAAASAVGVVDEAAADRIFSAVPRSHPARAPPLAIAAVSPDPIPDPSPAAAPDHPAMHLNLAPLRHPDRPPSTSPLAPPRDLSPSAWGMSTPLPDHRACTAPTPSPSLFARDAVGAWVCPTRPTKHVPNDFTDLSLPVKHPSDPSRPFPYSPGLPPATFNHAAFLSTTPHDPPSATPKKPRRPDLPPHPAAAISPSAKMEDVVGTPMHLFTASASAPTPMDDIRSPPLPPSLQQHQHQHQQQQHHHHHHQLHQLHQQQHQQQQQQDNPQSTTPGTGPVPMQLQLPHMRPVQVAAAVPSRAIPPRGRRTTRHRAPASADPQQPDSAGVDPLQCGRCRQRFARRSNLFKHQRSVHVKQRPFPCPLCSKKFKRRDHLNKHKRAVHAGNRQYMCEICGVGFAEKFNRDKHRNGIHHTKRPIRCPCGAYFRDRDNMLNCLRCKRLPGLQNGGS